MSGTPAGLVMPGWPGVVGQVTAPLVGDDPWLPVGAVFYADFTTEGTTNHYYAAGAERANEAAFLAALSGALTRASVGTYTDSGGLIATASTDVLRFNYVGGLPHALIEPAGTNIVLQSEDFTTEWGAYQVTRTANQTAAPDGNVTADKLTQTAANDVHQVLQTVVNLANTNYIERMFVKPDGARYVVLSFVSSGGDDGAYAVFDLQDGTITQSAAFAAGSLISASITPAANGFHRIELCAKTGSATEAFFLITFANTGTPIVDVYGRQTFAGNTANSVYAWGASLKVGSLVESYISTAGSSATRAADAYSFTIPAVVATIHYTFDDDSTQDASVSAGAYTVPTNLNRPNIKSMAGLL